jgi:hypothetical protein
MLRVLLILLATLVLVACGRARFTVTQVQQQCTTQEANGLINVNCPNGVNYSFPAPTDGIDGQDGVDGQNGTNGMNAQGILVVDPCGDNLNQVDEVLLIFPDKSVLAWYQGVGFVVLTPGVTYQTTDSQRCIFKIDSNANVSYP